MRAIISVVAFVWCSFIFSAAIAQAPPPIGSLEQVASTPYLKHDSVEITNITEINTPNLEFSPAYYLKGIVYLTGRREYGKQDPKINEPFFELFYSEEGDAGVYKEPIGYSLNLSSKFHEGPVCFTKNWDKIYFTRNNTSKKGVLKRHTDGKSRLKIFEASRGYSDWENIIELPLNSDDYNTCHPTLSLDGTMLYFSSDMPGGIGGMDLWYVEKIGDTWTDPKNLGDVVNTPNHEVFPYIHQTGSMFFASDRPDGLGGHDIYKVDNYGDFWMNLTNIGEPFNSTSDDFGLILDRSGTKGYITSNRQGGVGKDDIYHFVAPNGLIRMREEEVASIFTVIDKKTQDLIEGATIKLFERTEKGLVKENDAYEVKLVPSESNADELVMKLVRKEGVEPGANELLTDEHGQAASELEQDTEYIIIVSKDGYNTKQLNYFVTSDKGSIIPILLEANDCSLASGMVVNTENLEGIRDVTLQFVNHCNGKIENVFSSPYGEFEFCLPCNCEISVSVRKDGFEKYEQKINNEDCDESMPLVIELTPLVTGETVSLPNTIRGPSTLEEGSVIILENIYYDFNKYSIRRGAARELDELANIMRTYPSMDIELIAHTDCRGRSSYNRRLSRKRADAAMRYLTRRGISSYRIKPLGMGEVELRNDCDDGVDCSEEEHQYNRRTEIRVLDIGQKVNIRYVENAPEIVDRRRD